MGGQGSGNRTRSNPAVAKRAENVDRETNARIIAYTLALNDMPPVDHGEEEAMRRRAAEYFEMCAEHGMRPLVGNMALAFKVSKPTLWRILNGERSGSELGFTPATVDILKNTYAMVESNFEQVLTDAKNSVPLIYYSKAAMDWKEAPSESVVTHRSETPRLAGKTADEVAAKYAQIVGVEDVPKYELPAGDEQQEK